MPQGDSRITFFEFLGEWKTFKEEFAQIKEKVSVLETKAETKEEKELKVEAKTEYPVPPDYIEIVDTVLNKHFGKEYVPRIDIPAFEFTVIVPPKYNPQFKDDEAVKGDVAPQYRTTTERNEDKRTKVISNAEGQFGVKEWAERIFSTFHPDIQTQIIADRN